MAAAFPALAWQLEKLPYLVAVADAGSLRKASISLRISQPALTRAIQTLEAAAGVLLLHRKKTGVELTTEGHALVRVAKDTFKALGHFAATQPPAGGARTLRLVTHELLAPLLFGADGPASHLGAAVELRLTTDTSVRRLLAALEDYSADMGIVATAGARQGLVVQPLLRDELAFFCSKRFAKQAKLKTGEPLTLDALQRLPLIVAPGTLATAATTVEEWLYAHAPALAPTYRVGSIESVATLVGGSWGVGLLPVRLSAHLRGPGVHALPVAIRGVERIGDLPVSFCCQKDVWARDPLAQELHRALAHRFATL